MNSTADPGIIYSDFPHWPIGQHIKYEIDVLEALKAAGYSTYRIRKEKIFAEGTLSA